MQITSLDSPHPQQYITNKQKCEWMNPAFQTQYPGKAANRSNPGLRPTESESI